LLLKPSVLTNGVYGMYGKKASSKRKTGVLCAEDVKGQEQGAHSTPLENHEDEDEEDEDDEIAFYNPVILINDKSLLNALKHPKKH
jgi:hypothetical protein